MVEDLRGTRHSIISLVALLTCFGIIMVFSTTMTVGESIIKNRFIMREILWVLISFSAMMLFSCIDYHIFKKLTIPLIIIAYALLVLVLLIGPRINGACRWLRVGGVSFQPSELAKLALIIFTAHFIDKRGEGIKKFLTGFVPPLVLAGVAFVLILKEPDFGTGVLIGAIILVMLIVAGAPIVFTGPLVALNVFLPVVGYGALTGLLGHLYNRYALARIRQLAGPAESDNGGEQP